MEQQSRNRWRLIALLSLIVAVLAIASSRPRSDALASISSGGAGDGNIVVVPIQTARDGYGIAMVDLQGKTLWIYEIGARTGSQSRLRLLAARSWKYDRMLTEYNTGEPTPEQVRAILERLGTPAAMDRDPVKELQDQAQPDDI